jgi:hypothetical protein
MRITKAISDHYDDLNTHPDKVKFLLENGDGTLKKIMNLEHQCNTDVDIDST